jgi:hypothetical protein
MTTALKRLLFAVPIAIFIVNLISISTYQSAFAADITINDQPGGEG